MLTRDPEAFFAFAANLPLDAASTCAKSAFVVSPVGFRLSKQSAQDNRYMQNPLGADADTAMAEHIELQLALRRCLPVIAFSGDRQSPDAVFPNNAFAVTPRHLIVGHMRHPERQRETAREDIRGFFTDTLGRELRDLSVQPGICELTGSLIIDRGRGIGFCGLSERCDEIGAAAMHAAFGLNACLMFDLAEGEYHTNVVLSVLASRALLIAPGGFADPKIADAICAFYQDRAIVLSDEQKAAFAGNGIAVTDADVFLSSRAVSSLTPQQRAQFADYGFRLHQVPMPMLERAGGSLRCCVGEIY